MNISSSKINTIPQQNILPYFQKLLRTVFCVTFANNSSVFPCRRNLRNQSTIIRKKNCFYGSKCKNYSFVTSKAMLWVEALKSEFKLYDTKDFVGFPNSKFLRVHTAFITFPSCIILPPTIVGICAKALYFFTKVSS